MELAEKVFKTQNYNYAKTFLDLVIKSFEEKQIKPIIESIGEDFLRNKLLNLYRNKLTKDEKEKEKLILETRIKELQKQYDELNK